MCSIWKSTKEIMMFQQERRMGKLFVNMETKGSLKNKHHNKSPFILIFQACFC